MTEHSGVPREVPDIIKVQAELLWGPEEDAREAEAWWINDSDEWRQYLTDPAAEAATIETSTGQVTKIVTDSAGSDTGEQRAVVGNSELELDAETLKKVTEIVGSISDRLIYGNFRTGSSFRTGAPGQLPEVTIDHSPGDDSRIYPSDHTPTREGPSALYTVACNHTPIRGALSEAASRENSQRPEKMDANAHFLSFDELPGHREPLIAEERPVAVSYFFRNNYRDCSSPPTGFAELITVMPYYRAELLLYLCQSKGGDVAEAFFQQAARGLERQSGTPATAPGEERITAENVRLFLCPDLMQKAYDLKFSDGDLSYSPPGNKHIYSAFAEQSGPSYVIKYSRPHGTKPWRPGLM